MRTTDDEATVRLYHLDDDGGIAETLFYGALTHALAMAAEQTAAVQNGLFVQTDNDVIAYLDLVGT